MFTYNFLFAVLTYVCMYYCYYIHRPRIYSKNRAYKELGPKLIYPLIYLPFGFFQSVLQIFRKVQITTQSRMSKVLLKAEMDGELLIEIYEPLASVKYEKIPPKEQVSKIDGSESYHDNHFNVVLIHGLNGSSNSTYIKGMTNVFLKKDCRVFCFNARGAKIPPKSNFFSHIGLTSDVKQTVEYILNNYCGDVMVVGFSMGSNWTAKFFGEYSNPRVRAGVAICCPFDYLFLSRFFRSSYYSCLINYLFSKNYKKYLRKSMVDPPNLENLSFVDQIDSAILKILKHPNLNDFYEYNSCKHHIKMIDKPFLFINADDDPIIPLAAVPFEECLKNPNVGLMIIKGGHLGFITNGRETSVEKIVGAFYDKFVST